MLIAFLVARRNHTLQQAYDKVSAARRGLKINDGFTRTLIKWERYHHPHLNRTTLEAYVKGGNGMAD